MRRRTGRLIDDTRGAALVEFAMVAPLLLLILLGIIAYGRYFWMAHGLQQAANDGARAAIAGLTADERRTLSEGAVAIDLAGVGGIDPDAAATLVQDDGTTLVVAISYDTSRHASPGFGLVPLPAAVISRRATIRLGGL